MKYRSRTDITAQILEIAAPTTGNNNGGGTTKTKIMYKAYLSYTQLKEYLSVLMENGLIEYVSTEHKYRTTEKGFKFLSASDQLVQLSAPSDNHDGCDNEDAQRKKPKNKI